MVQLRITPYFLIALFSFAIMCVRICIIPDWKWWMHVISFCSQTFFMIMIWRYIKWLNDKLDPILPFERGPVQRMFIQVATVLLTLAPFIFAGLTFARPFLPSFVNKQMIALLIMVFVVMIVLFNFSFYTGYFFRNWQQSVMDKASLEIQAAQLERETFNLQYHRLRNQVNPHYLFNTLTSLDGLIQTSPDLASEFVRHMAKVYRYVLEHKESEVVRVEEELEFIGHYLHLLKARYGAALNIQCNVSQSAKEKGIVMVTLQLLIDNAVKHNMLLPELPLNIGIYDDGNFLFVTNGKQLRSHVECSHKEGLLQLRQLYRYLSVLPLEVTDNDKYFIVKIPLIIQ